MNTPDTEWRSKSVEIWGGKETPKEIAHAVVTHFSDFISTKIEEDIETVIERLISSRDTYWKERVRKEVEDYFDIRLEDLVNEHLLNEDPHTETRIFEAKKNRDEILTITNEDNLK